MSDYLSTTEAAKILKISKREVANLCRNGELPGVSKSESGRWKIPITAIQAWQESQISIERELEVDPGSSEGIRSNSFESRETISLLHRFTSTLKRSKVVITALTSLIFLVAAIIAIGNDFAGAKTQLQQWGIIPAFSKAKDGEALIVISTFYRTEGVLDTAGHTEIRNAITYAKTALGLTNLRVEIEPLRLRADERTKAEKLA